MNINGNGKANRLEGKSGNDVIKGFGGNDKISGHRGNDTIDGGSGNDKMGGGEGHDKLTGGSGADAFVFRSFKAADTDVITDFKHLTDELQFDHTVFTKVKVGDLAASAFHAGTKAHDASDRFIYDKASGKLYYDDDGNGAHAQHLVATLSNHATLNAQDILII